MMCNRNRRGVVCAWFTPALTLCVALAVVAAGGGSALAVAPTSTLVEFDFGTRGKVQVDLFDQLTPQSVANFVNRYVANNRYDGTMIHRITNKNAQGQGIDVVQGGGFTKDGTSITNNDPLIPLEYNHLNAKGTLAMARQTGKDTASSQWFFNTTDNSTALGPQTGSDGYTVFGWIVGPGLSTIAEINALPKFAFNSPFGEIPLSGYTQADFNAGVDPVPHVVELLGVNVVRTHAAFQNPYSSFDVNNSGTTSSNDVLNIINALLDKQGAFDVSGSFGETNNSLYYDVTGNGKVSPADALVVINELLRLSAAPQTLTASPQAVSITQVPEPSSLAMAGAGVVALGGYAWRRRRDRRAKAA